MINLIVENNLVKLNKLENEDYKIFVNTYLVKYEETLQVDRFSSTKYKKKFKSVRERRNLYSEDDKYIYFSKGILDFIPKENLYITDLSTSTIIEPTSTLEEIKKSLPMFDLRDDQVIAVNKCLKLKRGVIQLPTATGKSAIITSVVKNLIKFNPDIKILVLAPTLSTVSNIYDTLEECNVDVGSFSDTKNTKDHAVTTSLVQSLIAESKKDPELLENVNAVFYDECLPGNSKILMADYSHKTIEEIYEDDTVTEVMSFNLETNRYESKKILKKYKSEFNSKFWKLYYVNPLNNKLEGVICTKNHKIYVKNKGYIPLEEINLDDLIKIDLPLIRDNFVFTNATFVKIYKIVPNIGKTQKYRFNIEVEDNHNYFANDVLVSNCHHLKCDTWNTLNRLLHNVEYSIGFSALSIDKEEIYKTDIRTLSYDAALIVGCTGKVMMHMDPSYYIENRIIAQPIVFRVNHYVSLPDNLDESNWSQLVKAGLLSTERSIKIIEIAQIFSKYQRKILILVSEKEHAFILGEMLKDNGESNFGISFGAGEGYIYDKNFTETDTEINNVNYKKIESLKVVDSLAKGDIHVLLASIHLDEGVDVKQLDACILACSGKKDRRIIQRVGRVLRKSKTGKYAYIIDFTDYGSKVLNKQSNQRLKLYQENIGISNDYIADVTVDEVEDKFKRLENL